LKKCNRLRSIVDIDRAATVESDLRGHTRGKLDGIPPQPTTRRAISFDFLLWLPVPRIRRPTRRPLPN
jgi:hypothetical protein